MNSKKDDYVKQKNDRNLEEEPRYSGASLSIEEQIDLYADLIVEQLLIELNEKIKA